tara:strand:+ start:2007 stop:2852 length:846 start_codon:yes stop_codon:yes gene_type:complete
MDIVLIRTFLEVIQSGSFIRASEQLHVTQTAVTGRIQTLEESLGCRLFIRKRSGAMLTPEGERFLPYATSLNTTWAQARQRITVPEGHVERLRIGSETTLWNPLLTQWTAWLKTELPEVAVDSMIAEAPDLNDALEQGQLDAVILHRPNYHAGCQVEQLLEEKLMRVQNPEQPKPDVYIDWGPDVEKQYMASATSPRQCAYTFNFGPAALQFLLSVGGNGWFRSRVVQPYLDSGKLVRIPDADEYTYPVFLVYRSPDADSSLERALTGLRDVTAADTPWHL